MLQAPNRRVQRLMEKENKKLRSAAKKKRNETVRVSINKYMHIKYITFTPHVRP